MRYSLIYVWRGERHRALQQGTLEEMTPVLEAFRRDGWRCWLEELG